MLRKTLPLALLFAAACSDAPPPSSPAADEHAAHETMAASRGDLGPDVLRMLAEVRRATARYHDVDKAFADGYNVWSPAPGTGCATSAEGQMGYHLVKVPLRGSPLSPATADAVLDPLQPEMLLYELRRDGKLHLVGVEYLVFQAAWERVHGAGAAPPTLLGQTVPFSSHTFPGTGTTSVPHYELHVWIWSQNPNGMFSHWNPTVTC